MGRGAALRAHDDVKILVEGRDRQVEVPGYEKGVSRTLARTSTRD